MGPSMCVSLSAWIRITSPPPPPPLPPSPISPPSTPIAASSEGPFPVQALWALLPLSVLLVAALVLFYRYRYRLLRDRANAVLSRDRAHVDLQMMVHQVKKVQTKADGSIAS